MKYPALQEPCKSMIAKGYCLGCNKLELENFTHDWNCEALEMNKKKGKDKWKRESIKNL